MNLHTAGHRRGVVAAPHVAAVEAGRQALSEGGNAIEAMLTMAASIAVLYPHMNHLGGDGFWLIREPGGRVRAIMAAGPAGAKATLEFYRAHGCDKIPPHGAIAALTVPGAVGGWMLALEAAKARGGKMPLASFLAPAIKAAREGYAITRSQARATAKELPKLKDVPGFAAAFLADGKAPEQGTLQAQKTFAETLEQLAHVGLDDFYRGDVGREVAADLERIGSPVTRKDLESYRAYAAEPLSVAVAAGTLYNTPPPTVGITSLTLLALADRLQIRAEGFDFVHRLVEATKRAYALRDRFVTDPRHLPEGFDRLLTSAFLDAQAREVDLRKAAPKAERPDGGDTIWMGAADSSGLMVSYIQSLFFEYGAGVVLPHTGLVMQNRGTSFSLKKGAVNALAPGRLPPHTLNPAFAVLNDGRLMSYGTRGGDGQPQTQASFFMRHIGFHQPLAEALDRPRWRWGAQPGDPHPKLRMEARFDGDLVGRLEEAGHDVVILPEDYAETLGQAGAVILHPNGTFEGAHDPRADGGAAGL